MEPACTTISLLKISPSLEATSLQSDAALLTMLSPTLKSPMKLQVSVSVAISDSSRSFIVLNIQPSRLSAGLRAHEYARDARGCIAHEGAEPVTVERTS